MPRGEITSRLQPGNERNDEMRKSEDERERERERERETARMIVN
jgi:hypothetical protein